jgi:carbonic anhydrase
MEDEMRYRQLLDNNRAWVEATRATDPGFFARLAAKHAPHVLWIGCSDARVPANVVTGTDAGEMFVHRNIANQVMPMDTNLQAVLQYAVDVLQVGDVVVCGHSGCGGVLAAMSADVPPPYVDSWIGGIRQTIRLHGEELESLPANRRADRLVELNVVEQVRSLCGMGTVRDAWTRGQDLRIHGWVYRLEDGLLRDLGVTRDASSTELMGAA